MFTLLQVLHPNLTGLLFVQIWTRTCIKMGKIRIYIFAQMYHIFRIIDIRNCLRAQEHANLNAKTFCPLCTFKFSQACRFVNCEFWIVIKGKLSFADFKTSKPHFTNYFLGHFLFCQLANILNITTMVFWEYQNIRIMYAVRKCLVYLNAHTLV